MSNLSIDQLKAAFASTSNASTSSGPSNYYPFWNMKTDERCMVRFLPDLDTENPMGFLFEKLTHRLPVNGQEQQRVPCLKMYGEECPICAVAHDYYKQNDTLNGGKFWHKRSWVSQAVILEDPLPVTEGSESHAGHVRYLPLGKQIFTLIQGAFQEGDLDEAPYEFKGGTNFIIKKSMLDNRNSYMVGTKFERNPSDLSDQDISFVQEQMVKLSSLKPMKPSMDYVQACLHAAVTGEMVELPAYTENGAATGTGTTPNVVSTAPSIVSTNGISTIKQVEDNMGNSSAPTVVQMARNSGGADIRGASSTKVETVVSANQSSDSDNSIDLELQATLDQMRARRVRQE